MTRTVLCISILLMIALPREITVSGVYGSILPGISVNINTASVKELTAMEALDIVRNRYAANFEKVYPAPEAKDDLPGNNSNVKYYYKLPLAEYYLVFEGQGESGQDYLFHLYEFVLDEPDTGFGHTVTYGWYTVDRRTGIITDQTAY